MFTNIIVKYAELSLKGNNRTHFSKKLESNIQTALQKYPVKVKRYYDYIDVVFENKISQKEINAIESIIEKIPGISIFFLSTKTNHDPEMILKVIEDQVNNLNINKFKIEVKRYYKEFIYDSSQFKQLIGKSLPDHLIKKVEFYKPKNIIWIFIYKDCAMIAINKKVSQKGLPVGSNGKALVLISGGIDSPVASYLLLKKGLELEYVHFVTPPTSSPNSLANVKKLIQKLNNYSVSPQKLHIVNFTPLQNEIMCSVKEDYRIIIMRRFFLQISAIIAKNCYIETLATGESLGQVASQTIRSLFVTQNAINGELILRPLIGLSKDEIIIIAKKIGTYETSIEPFPDCCTLFLPKSPTTKPALGYAKYYQEKVFVEDLKEYVRQNCITEIIK